MLDVEDMAHRENDVAVSLVEVAMSTQRHQHQFHFLEGSEEYSAVPPPAFTTASFHSVPRWAGTAR